MDEVQTRNSLPIKCNQIDHYTLIVPNAKKVSDFHINVLGFHFIRIQLINAGSAPQGKYDMLNYVLSWPNDPKRVLVITEGLTETSIFNRFMNKFGQGIHHLAFEVDDMDKTFQALNHAGIPMTSDKIMNDMLTGLKQVFLDNQNTGIFVELIERPSEDSGFQTAKAGVFTQDNMAGLAQTMENYLEQQYYSIKDTGIEQYIPQSNYYEVNQGILGVHPFKYLVGINNLPKSASFFRKTLELSVEEQSEKYFNLKLWNNSLPFLQYFHSNSLVFCGLRCSVNKLQQAISVLEQLKISYQTAKNTITLNKQYAGYPLQLYEEA